MRLLNTTSGRFVQVDHPEDTRYAILSHTWALAGEQDYKEILFVQAAVSTAARHVSPFDSILSHPTVSPKVREACRVARSHGFELLWIDSCCIDKSNNTELIESLNSMYEWYHRATVCYVYLADVPFSSELTQHGSPFRASRWHRRGWTLQELIAPTHVVFLSLDWRPLGTKTTLATLLESITGIDTSILLHTAPLSSVSVARRMWWASSRETKRVEDQAYALMGIFDVKLHMDYGEGHHAFILLQEEILKKIPADQSIFAWGPRFSSVQSHASPVSFLRMIEERMVALDMPLMSSQCPPRSLFATSPCDFRNAEMIAPLNSMRFDNLLWGDSEPRTQRGHVSSYVPSPHGFRLKLPLVRYTPSTLALQPQQNSYRDCRCGGFECTWLALLPCTDDAGNVIALPLCEPPAGTSDEGLLVGTRKATCLDCKRYYRTCALSPADVHAVRADISIAPLVVRRTPLNGGPTGAPPLRIRRVVVQPWCKFVLATHGYDVSLRRTAGSSQDASSPSRDYVLTLRRIASDAPSPSSSSAHAEIEVQIAQGDRTDGVTYTLRQGRGLDPRADTVPHTHTAPTLATPPLRPTMRAGSPRVEGPPQRPEPARSLSRFVPFVGRGEARHEFELRGGGLGGAAGVRKLHLTLENQTEPAWTFGGWGQAPHVDFLLNIELSAGAVAVAGNGRRSSTL